MSPSQRQVVEVSYFGSHRCFLGQTTVAARGAEHWSFRGHRQGRLDDDGRYLLRHRRQLLRSVRLGQLNHGKSVLLFDESERREWHRS